MQDTAPTDDALTALGAAVSGPSMMRDLRGFAPWVKLSGTPDELASLRFIEQRIAAYGLRTTMLMHDAFISLPGPARVELGNVTLTAITHSMSRSAPPGGVRGRVVDVGEGSAADFAGRDLTGCIVLAEGIASPAVAARASAAGAVGQLHISPHEHLHEMCISPIWGSPSAANVDRLPTTVACTISLADGMALRERLARGETPHVVLHAEVDTGWRPTPILVAELDAPGAGPETPFILLSGHHDTWYEGVMDNGTANVTMLEVARLCAEQRAGMRRSLRVCFWSGHSHGRYSGSTWYADEHWAELDRRCAAHVNVDSTGGVGATVMDEAGTATELRALAEDALRRQADAPHAGKRKARNSDESFCGIGIPSMFGSLSHQPAGPVKMRNALGWWWHTPHDLLDKIDEANLVRDTRVFVHAVWRLLSEPVLPLDQAAQLADLHRELAKLAPSLAGQLDIGALAAEAARLASLAGAATRDRARMRLARALVPIDYALGNRFEHDAALPLPAWPVLQPLRDLAAAPEGSDAARLAATEARRARNRVAQALREAAEALQA